MKVIKVSNRDAIFGPYSEFARFGEKDVVTNYTKYYDTHEKEKIYRAYDAIDEIIALRESRVSKFSKSDLYDNKIEDESKERFDFQKNKDTIDLSEFNKIIYVDQFGGSDMNDGSENNPVKTIRRAEDMIIDGTCIIVADGIYDITFDNGNSNPIYCTSGLSGGDKNYHVTYCAKNNLGDVTFVVNTNGLEIEARDISFMSDAYNVDVKNIIFKMVDKTKDTLYGATISRGSGNISFIDCVFDLELMNGNIIYNMKSIDFVSFENCIINIQKDLNAPINNKVHKGSYTLKNCFVNQEIKDKIEEFDLGQNEAGEISMIGNFNTRFFSKKS